MTRVHITDRRLSNPDTWERFTDPYEEYENRDPFGEAIAEAGGRLTYGSAETEAELRKECAGADVIMTFMTPLPGDLIESLEETELIIRNGVGYDNIDVAAATRSGIPVSNVPGNCNDEMTSHALALMLTAAHELVAYDRQVREQNGWNDRFPVNQLIGGTCGIVGLGRVGRAVVPKVRGLGMDIVAYDPHLDADVFEYLDVERVSFEELLDRSDAVTIHAPLTDRTANMFSSEAFDRMNRRAVLVNTARGPIVDESALVQAVENGEIWGAGLDVFDREPPTNSPVLECERIVCSPHRAGIAPEAERRAIRIARDEIVRALRGETPRHVVNGEVFQHHKLTRGEDNELGGDV